MCVQDSLDKQTLYSQTLSEKLWMAERQMEELQIDKDNREKKTSELQSTILRLEAEVQRWILLTSIVSMFLLERCTVGMRVDLH